MKVIRSGYDYREESCFHVERPFGIGIYVLLIIRSPACINLNDQTHYLKGNNVIVYRKGSAQYFAAHNTEFVNDWVAFDLEEEDLLFLESIGIQFDTIMEFSDVHALSRIVKLLFIERWANNPNAEESNTLLLRLLFLKLSDFITKRIVVSSELTEKLAILKNNIYCNPQKDWSIENICKSLSISPSYLHSTYKQMFGSSIKADVIASRIEYSKDLLANTDLKISVIAHRSGYETDVHFMYMFKKKTGLTPSQYRKASIQTVSSIHAYIK